MKQSIALLAIISALSQYARAEGVIDLTPEEEAAYEQQRGRSWIEQHPEGRINDPDIPNLRKRIEELERKAGLKDEPATDDDIAERAYRNPAPAQSPAKAATDLERRVDALELSVRAMRRLLADLSAEVRGIEKRYQRAWWGRRNKENETRCVPWYEMGEWGE